MGNASVNMRNFVRIVTYITMEYNYIHSYAWGSGGCNECMIEGSYWLLKSHLTSNISHIILLASLIWFRKGGHLTPWPEL